MKLHCSFLLAATLLAAFAAVSARPQSKLPRITGTYSNMYFNKEGGDVVGDEIKIVATGKGYQGALQFAEGAPSNLIVVDITFDGTKISFSVPDSDSYASQFVGTVENGFLKGQFHFKTGATEKVELRRGKSYWD